MKKIVLLIVLATVYSCSEEATEEATVNNQSLTINADMNPTSAVTGKPVQRGSLFASVNAIQVKNTCAEWNYTNYTDFEIVPNGTAGAANSFNIDKVYSGINVFTATTTTNIIPNITTSTRSRAPGTINSSNTTIKNVFTTEKAKNPYAVYTETNPVTTNITIGTAQNITIPMSTKNSRVIVYFSLVDLIGSNSSNIVTVETYKGGTISGGTISSNNGFSYWKDSGLSNSNTNRISSGTKIGGNTNANSSSDGLFYMSNDTEIAGNKITFRIIHNDRSKYDIYYFTTTLKTSNTGSFLIAVNNTTLSIYGM